MNTSPTVRNSACLVAFALAAATPGFAQGAPGFEPSITPAVRLSWPASTNKAYQVMTAGDVSGAWTAIGQLLEGNGGLLETFIDSTNHHQFFRIQQTTNSPLSWLNGTWVGPACQTGASIPLYSFTTRVQADATNRVFTVRYSGPFSCNSVLTLVSYTDNQAVFHESVQSGNCFDETVMLTRINPTNLAFHFVSTSPAGTGGGLLVKQ